MRAFGVHGGTLWKWPHCVKFRHAFGLSNISNSVMIWGSIVRCRTSVEYLSSFQPRSEKLSSIKPVDRTIISYTCHWPCTFEFQYSFPQGGEYFFTIFLKIAISELDESILVKWNDHCIWKLWPFYNQCVVNVLFTNLCMLGFITLQELWSTNVALFFLSIAVKLFDQI